MVVPEVQSKATALTQSENPLLKTKQPDISVRDGNPEVRRKGSTVHCPREITPLYRKRAGANGSAKYEQP